MERILIVEESVTLRYLLVKAFSSAGFQPIESGSYSRAREFLFEHNNGQAINGLVIGWSNAYSVAVLGLLNELENLSETNPPALLFVTDHFPIDLLEWISQYPRFAHIVWECYQDSVQAMKRLLGNEGEGVLVQIATSQAQVAQLSQVGQGCQVLIVVHSSILRRNYQRLLTGQGYMTRTAATVQEAVTLAKRYRFDLAIVDYHMPDDSGSALCKRLKSNPESAHVRIVIVTGGDADSIARECLEVGATEYMFENESSEFFLTRVASIANYVRVEKLEKTERSKLSAVLNSVHEGVYSVDLLGNITNLNSRGVNLLGFSSSESLIGKSAHELIHHQSQQGVQIPQSHCELCENCSSGKRVTWKGVFKQARGKVISVQYSTYPVIVDGRLEGSVVAFHDIEAIMKANRIEEVLEEEFCLDIRVDQNIPNEQEGELYDFEYDIGDMAKNVGKKGAVQGGSVTKLIRHEGGGTK